MRINTLIGEEEIKSRVKELATKIESAFNCVNGCVSNYLKTFCIKCTVVFLNV